MSGRKKKISKELRISCAVLIGLCCLLILLLEYLLVKNIIHKEVFYQIESREENIENSKKEDSDNHETIGWVRVQGTNIDYTLYGVLKNDFSYPVVSQTYMWSLNFDSKFHSTMIVYGHNIMNLGPNPKLKSDQFERMEELMGFVYYDFAKENKYIQLSIDGENYLYKIFAVNFMTVDELDSYPKGEFDSTAKNKYFSEITKNSIYDYDVDVSVDDDILSVVTCSRFFKDGKNYDFIVTGRRVKDGEKIENYKVSRNKNYEKINEILKGDEDNEK